MYAKLTHAHQNFRHAFFPPKSHGILNSRSEALRTAGYRLSYIGTGSKISRKIGVACWKFSKKSENSSLSYPRAQGSLARTLSRPYFIPRSWIKNKTVYSVVKKKQQPFAFVTKLHLFPSNEKNSKHFHKRRNRVYHYGKAFSDDKIT